MQNSRDDVELKELSEPLRKDEVEAEAEDEPKPSIWFGITDKRFIYWKIVFIFKFGGKCLSF